MRNRTVIVATLLELAVVATACTSSTTTSAAAPASPSPTATASPIPTAPAPAADVTGKSSFTINTYDNFSPNVLMGSANQQLSLTIDNKGTATHTFTIQDENVDVLLAPGTSQTVKITFPKSGSTEFVCRFHESMGMTGELQVQ